MPSYLTISLGSLTLLLGSLILAVLASFPVVKYMSSVLAKSNYIVFSALCLYIFATSLSRILIFFLRLVDTIVSKMLSMYKRILVEIRRKRSLI